MPRDPRYHPKKCKHCGAQAIHGAQISYRGICRSCGIRRMETAIEEMANKSGPTHDAWRRGILAKLLAESGESTE